MLALFLTLLSLRRFSSQRAVLCSSGRAIDMSHDHKPAREDEKARIEKLGGKVIHYGTWRVQGVLATSRSFGDRRLKTYVTAEPEVKTRQLQDGDDFLILASDGVWDVLSSQEAVDIVKQAISEGSPSNTTSNGSVNGTLTGDIKDAARRLTNAAYGRHSMDNITSMVINLGQFR
jgi:serine/threonine protein phosphatase PrpC